MSRSRYFRCGSWLCTQPGSKPAVAEILPEGKGFYLFDHLVGEQLDRVRDIETKLVGGLDVEHKLVLGR